MDKVTLDRIETLHPKLREEALKIYTEIDAALTGKVFCRFSQVLRTIEEQDALYAQGRTKKGKIVTNARGGSSYHNYGLAIDIVLIDGNVAEWSTTKDFDADGVADWKEVVNIFKKYGWKWGGEFISIKDYPHFEKSFGYSVTALYNKYKAKDFIKGTKYVNI